MVVGTLRVHGVSHFQRLRLAFILIGILVLMEISLALSGLHILILGSWWMLLLWDLSTIGTRVVGCCSPFIKLDVV